MIGVYLRRRSDLKILGSTLDALVARGVPWVWCWDEDDRKEPVQEAELARWPGPVESPEACRVLVAADAPYLPVTRVPIVAIPYFWDNRLAPPVPGRVVCYTSALHRARVAALWGPQPDPLCPIVGWTESDQALLPELLGGCPGVTGPYAVLFTMKMRVPDPWRQSREGHRWYRMSCEMIRAMVERRGWTLVVKSRAKHGDPGWLQRLSQHYMLDECMYPHTTWGLLKGAQEAIHFTSGLTWQAMILGIPHHPYRVPFTHVDALPGQFPMEPSFDGTLDRGEFLRDWIAPVDGQAGQRVVDLLVRAC